MIAMTSQSNLSTTTSPRGGTGRTDSTAPLNTGTTASDTNRGMSFEGNEGRGGVGAAVGIGGAGVGAGVNDNLSAMPNQAQLQMNLASGSTSGYDSGGDDGNIAALPCNNVTPYKNDDAMSKLERDAQKMDIQIND